MHATKNIYLFPLLLNPRQTTRIFISTQEHHFRKPPRTLLHTNSNNNNTTFTNSTRLTIESALYIFSFDFQPRVPFSPYSLSLSPHPREHEAVHRSHGDNKGTILSPFPTLSRYLLYLSIGHSWNERRRDRAAHGFHPPNEKELRSSIFARIHRSSPDLSKGTLFSLSLPLSRSFSFSPRVSMQIPQAKGPDYTRSTHTTLPLQRTQPTQQEARRGGKRREKKYMEEEEEATKQRTG